MLAPLPGLATSLAAIPLVVARLQVVAPQEQKLEPLQRLLVAAHADPTANADPTAIATPVPRVAVPSNAYATINYCLY